MENKCEKLGIEHAWRSGNEMYGFQTINTELCANCGLKRSKGFQTKEWWSYSDGRPNEEIIDIRPL